MPPDARVNRLQLITIVVLPGSYWLSLSACKVALMDAVIAAKMYYKTSAVNGAGV